MSGMGMALMGTGYGTGEGRAMDATKRAISSPLLEETSIEGARGVLINVTGGRDLALYEINQSISVIREAAHEEANILFGAVINESLQGEMKITVIATGFDHAMAEAVVPPIATAMKNVATPRIVSPQPFLNAATPPEPTPVNPVRQHPDLDVPTFIRKKAD
jgi:cell division protein FtsZ